MTHRTHEKLLLCVGLCFTFCPAAADTGQAALAKDLSKGGTVLLLGASMFDLHEGDKRIESVMKSLLEQRRSVPERVQGRSFLKLARQGDAAWKDRAFAQLSTAMLRTPEFKFIDNSQDLSGDFELYDMRNDPKEERNLAGDPRHRDLVAHSKQRLTAWRADKPAPVKIAGMATPDYALIADAPERRRQRKK